MSTTISTPTLRFKIPLRAMLFTALSLMLSLGLQAQVSVTCPPNAVIATDPGICGALYNYNVTTTGGGIQTVTFSYTGAAQTWTVPNGVTSITVEVWGAQGRSNALGVVGGLGGYATGTLAVTPGSTLEINVGGGGTTGTTGGFNGGGAGGAVGATNAFGGGGGGGTDVRMGGNALTDRVIVGGGGGGAAGNRVATQGRGTGGGGGGGYYGGGGGAAWPSASLVVPTGGTQSIGGNGGTSTFTSAPNNNGLAGVLGIGGKGGDEVTSNQGGSQTASSGGTGGGTTGANGTYAGNFAGQSGAGGSGYIGGVTSGSMTSGLRSGNGQAIITYSNPVTTTLLAGFASGSTFPTGLTTNTLMVTGPGNSDTCTFTLTVNDSTAPTLTCPTFDTLYVDSTCAALVPDYANAIVTTDNCTNMPMESQSLTVGSALTGLAVLHPITFMAADSAGNIDSCSFAITLMDMLPPVMQCPAQVDFTPSTFDCNPQVNFAAGTATDNCGPSQLTSNHNPGDNFPVGSTTVTYYGIDAVGNADSCSFLVVVHMPVVTGQVTMNPQVVCAGDPITLSAPGGFTHLWSTNAISSSITVTSPGAYWVQMTDLSGCTAIEYDTVDAGQFTTPQPVVTPTGPSLCTGTFTTYQWNLNGSPIPGATAQCYQPTTDGDYSVSVTDALGCDGLSDTLFFVGVADGFTHARFELFPNPAGNAVNLRMEQPLLEQGNILVMDLTGRVVILQPFAQLQGVVNLDLSRLAKGSYIVKVLTPSFEGRRNLMHIE